MKISQLIIVMCLCHASLAAQTTFPSQKTFPAKKEIYHKGWIDFNKNGVKDIYEDPTQDIDARVANLLSLMTVEEKTCQLATLYGYRRVLADDLPNANWNNEVWKDGIANIDEHLNGLKRTPYSYPYSLHARTINEVQRWFVEQTRLGIPVDFSNEGIHGLNHDRSTPLPAPISIGSTWNKQLVHQAGLIVGREAKALGYTNVYAPILDVARDQRWGRVLECYSEDPYLVTALGREMVNGIQANRVASTLKHYAIYSVPVGGRDGFCRTDPHVAPREMHSIHLYPYRKIVPQASPKGVMSSYNDYDGVPVSASHYFLTELLRWEYGFNGYIVSDSEAAEYPHTKHHTADSMEEAYRQEVVAGMNVRTNFTQPKDFIMPVRKLIAEGRLAMADVDRNVADVLRVKFWLGLFDHPYVENPDAADKIVANEQSQEFVKQMARESIVLLKNQDNTLPLNRLNTHRILVTGPLATDTTAYISRYGSQKLTVTNVLQGIRNIAGDGITVDYAKGCEVIDKSWPESEIIPTPITPQEQSLIDQAVEQARNADVVIAVVGEDAARCGENNSRTSLDLPGRQRQLLQALHATGKPVVMVLINGQPLTVNWEDRYLHAIVEAWFPNAWGGNAIAEVIFGDYNPGGKLPITFPRTVGQIEFNFPFKPAAHAGQATWGDNGAGKTSVFGALYPFGFGLSYTTFSYSNLQVSPTKGRTGSTINVSVDVTNTGSRAGDDVVQLYFKDLYSSVTTYEMQLRGFERINLQPGETRTVHFTLQPGDLELLDANMHWTVEPGDFKVCIGSSSEDIKLEQQFTLEK
ncbi:MAG: glycoside hydrolase family 3 N-terminal domain-containing protein [Muribaculaceae bacterium]